jgi:hypothetical protein
VLLHALSAPFLCHWQRSQKRLPTSLAQLAKHMNIIIITVRPHQGKTKDHQMMVFCFGSPCWVSEDKTTWLLFYRAVWHKVRVFKFKLCLNAENDTRLPPAPKVESATQYRQQSYQHYKIDKLCIVDVCKHRF